MQDFNRGDVVWVIYKNSIVKIKIGDSLDHEDFYQARFDDPAYDFYVAPTFFRKDNIYATPDEARLALLFSQGI